MVTDPRPMGFEPQEEPPLLDPQRVLRGRCGPVPDLRLARFRAACAAQPEQAGALAVALLREVAADARDEADAAVPLPTGPSPTAREQRDDRMVAFFQSLPEGATWLYYRVRAGCEGSLHALPPSVEPMYAPERAALGEATAWQVGGPEASAGAAPSALLAVAAAITPVDPEALLTALEERTVPEVLRHLLTEPALRVWLQLAPLRPETPGLREQVEAARTALAWRQQCTAGLGQAPAAWAPAVAAALAEDQGWRAVLAAATSDIASADNLLLWADADREHRLQLFRALQGMLGTRELAVALPRPVTVAAMVAALGARAPVGDARVHWLMTQRLGRESLTLGALLDVCAQGLGLTVRTGDLSAAGNRTVPAEGTVRAALEHALQAGGLYFAVRDGALWVGSAAFVSGQ